jgi:hypothetical protein
VLHLVDLVGNVFFCNLLLDERLADRVAVCLDLPEVFEVSVVVFVDDPFEHQGDLIAGAHGADALEKRLGVAREAEQAVDVLGVDGQDEVFPDQNKERMHRHGVVFYGHRGEHDPELCVVVLVCRVKTGGEFGDGKFRKAGCLCELLDLLRIVFGAVIDPGNACRRDCREVLLQRPVDLPVDPAVLGKDDTEVEGGGSRCCPL